MSQVLNLDNISTWLLAFIYEHLKKYRYLRNNGKEYVMVVLICKQMTSYYKYFTSTYLKQHKV